MTSLQKHDLGGTFRACNPSETLARVQCFFPALRITRVADVTGLDRIGIPVVMCVRPNARSLSVSQGKGISLDLAKVSGVMESIELYHAEHLRPPDIVATYQHMRRLYRTVDPQDLEPGSRWGAYAPSKKIAWMQGIDLVRGEAIFVPYAPANMNLTGADSAAHLLRTTTNGLASGNTRWEAILHGLCEVIERDSDWRWNQLPPAVRERRLLNNQLIASPLVQALLEQYRVANIAAGIWDITSELGIPAYRSVIWDIDGWRSLGSYYGSGCHLSREIALCRALTEAAQSRLTYISGSRDDCFPDSYKTQQAHWAPSPEDPLPVGTRDMRECAEPPIAATFEEDVHYVVSRLVKAGFSQVVAVDLTKPEFNIPVVHVSVPRLRDGNDYD